MEDLDIPSAVTILEAEIEKRKAVGQRFAHPRGSAKDAPGGYRIADHSDHFRSARCAPNEDVSCSQRFSEPIHNPRISFPISRENTV